MTTILTKKKDTTGAPAPGDLTNSAGGAELAVNTFDKRLYTKDAGGNVVEIGTNPSAIVTSSITDSGNLTFTGTGNRITGNFGSGAVNTRVVFQSSSSNTQTNIVAVENGTTSNGSGAAQFVLAENNYASTGTDFVSAAFVIAKNTDVRIVSATTGTATALPITIYTGGSERLRIDTSGNVGIGTTSTTISRLNVVGTAGGEFARFTGLNKAIDGTGNVQIFTTNSQAADLGGSLALGGANGSAGAFDPWAFAVLKGAKENSTSGNLAGYFAIATASSGGIVTESMRITSAGNVGIGTSPTARLSVSTATSATVINLTNSSGQSEWQQNGTDLFLTNYNASGSAIFRTNGLERMRILSTGNVGIGTISPVAKLSVTNISTTNSAALDLIGNRNFTEATFGATSLIAVSDATRGIHDFGAIRFEQNPTTADGGGALFRMFVGGASSTFPSAAEFLRATANNLGGVDNIALRTQDADRLYITSGGFVGIGTSSPGQRLHVAGVGYFGPLGGEGGEVQLAATGGTVGAVLDVDSSNNLRIINAANTLTLFSVNSIERMRLTPTNLLIGTNSELGAIGNNVGLVTGMAKTAFGQFISSSGSVWNDIFTIVNPGLYILHAYIPGYNSGPSDWSNSWMVSYTGGSNIFVGPSMLGATGNIECRVNPSAATTVQVLSSAGAGITYQWAVLRVS